MKTPRIAVIGAGRLGGIHARALSKLPDANLVAIVDPVESQGREVAASLGVPWWPRHEDSRGQIDAAVVATPTRFHHAVALDLLKHGVHLLVEKPLTTTLAQADELVDWARRMGRTLQVGHVERFNPAFTAAQSHLSEPKFIEATRRGGFTFRSTDIGVVLDLMIHDIDLTLSLARSPVKKIEALGAAAFGRFEDMAHARITFENGLIANLNASRVSRSAERVMRVWSRRGIAHLDFAERSATLTRPSEIVLRHELDVETLSPAEKSQLRESLLDTHLPVEKLVTEPCDQITAELADFVESVRLGRAPQVSGEQGRAALAVAEEIIERIAHHSWDGSADGPTGALWEAPPRILRGPHWPSRTASSPSVAERGKEAI